MTRVYVDLLRLGILVVDTRCLERHIGFVVLLAQLFMRQEFCVIVLCLSAVFYYTLWCLLIYLFIYFYLIYYAFVFIWFYLRCNIVIYYLVLVLCHVLIVVDLLLAIYWSVNT